MKKINAFFKKIKNYFTNEKENNEIIPDYLANEQIIMKLLFYFDFTKISTKESILLYQKIEENFKKEMKNRENFAQNELEIIENFKNKLQK